MTSANNPAARVAASWAPPDPTWTVAATRPSARSWTRAWRTEVSATSNSVTAPSPMSCWPTRNPKAMSGRPAGASGMRANPTDATSIDAMAARPTPRRRVTRSAIIAPTSELRPPKPAMTPIAAATESELINGEQDPDSPEDAPQRRHGHLGKRECPDDRVARDDRQTLAYLAEDRLAVRFGRWRRFPPPDRTEQQGRDDERDGVDEDRDRGAQQLDEEAADPESRELGGRARCRERAVRAHELVAPDDRREVCVVGGVEERAEDCDHECDEQQVGEGQPSADGRDRDRHEQHRPTEVRPDHHRTTPQPIDPGAHDQPEHQRGEEVDGAHERHLERPGAEHEDRHERERHPGDQRSEDRDRRRRPHADERAVLPEWGGERVAHGSQA